MTSYLGRVISPESAGPYRYKLPSRSPSSPRAPLGLYVNTVRGLSWRRERVPRRRPSSEPLHTYSRPPGCGSLDDARGSGAREKGVGVRGVGM